MRATLTALFHGVSGIGKSWLGATTPGPRLILDAEGRARFAAENAPGAVGIVFWDPMTANPPVADGTWDTCIVQVLNFQTIDQVFQWLRSGQHPFVSVTMDSLMEVQKRCVDMLVPGVSALERDNYGELLRRVEKLVRDYRDLVSNPSNGVDCMIFITGSKQNDKGEWTPILTGAIRDTLPFYIDVVGYYYKQPTAEGTFARGLLVEQQPGFIAKDGTNRLITAYGSTIWNPNITEMMGYLNGKAAPTAA